MEIKFSDEKKIYSAVYYAVKEALGDFGTSNENFVIKEHKDKEQKKEEQESNTDGEFKSKYFDFSYKKPESEKKEEKWETIHEISKPEIKYNVSEKTSSYVKNDYKILGEAFYGYILVEKDEKIVIIDKHAAHERIIYDIIIKKALEKNKNSTFKSQILFISEEVVLNPKEAAGILDIEDEIKNLGIAFEWKNENTVLITELPVEISETNAGDIIKEAAYLSSEGNPAANQTVIEKLAMISAKKSAACRAAMKSGISDSAENISWLAERVLSYENVKYCPHGRPVAFEITKTDIEKQFKR
jgi:DNA mismatch repair protein MutL